MGERLNRESKIGVSALLLVIDVGNTNIVVGVYREEVLEHHWRLRTLRDETEDEIGLHIKSLLADGGLRLDDIDDVIISSVVPPLMPAFERMCQRYFGQPPMIVSADLVPSLPILYDTPRDVGADRLVDAVAAIEEYGYPLIIVDLGTANTFSVIDEKGQYLGGVIMPGIQISTEALFQRAAKLPRIELVKPPSVIGQNTVHAMQSGMIFGSIGQVDGIIKRIREELPLPYRVVATGGISELVCSESEWIDVVDPLLTLKGLRHIWKMNSGNNREGEK